MGGHLLPDGHGSSGAGTRRLLRERADRPFGDTELGSSRALAPYSQAGLAAAENLLVKAERALDQGDEERMRRYVGLAAALNYDDREQTAPAAWEVRMLLFNTIVDTLEDSPEGDSRWLDAAVAAMESADEWGRSELRHTLLDVRQDHVLEAGESQTIADLVAPVPERADLRDLQLPSEELADALVSVLRTVHAYRRAL